MLLGRVFGALRLQREECLDQARPRVARIDDVVEVAARRRLIGMGELFAVLVGALFARLSLIENLDRSLGTHAGDLRRGPGHVVVAADVLGAHDVVRAAIRLARDDGELRNRGFTVGEQQLRAVLDDTAMFLGHPGKKPGHVLEGHERNVEGVAEADEPGALERGGDVEHAGEGGRLIGDHADRPAGEPGEPDDQVVAVVPLDLEKRRVVDDVAEDVVHVVRLRRLIRDDLEERLFAAVGRIIGRAGRGTVQIVAGRNDSSVRIAPIDSSSESCTKWAMPEVPPCTSAPPSFSKSTSSCVTDFTTFGPVTNMYEIPRTMKMKSVMAGL